MKSMQDLAKKPPQRRHYTNIASFSNRKEAFLYFDNHLDPNFVAIGLNIPLETAKRYYRAWNKLPLLFNQQYILVRQTMRRMSLDEKALVWQALADELGCEVDEIEERMTKPWALRNLVTQRWRQWEVNITKNKRAAHGLRRVISKIMKRSDDAECVIEIALGKPAHKWG